MPKKTASAKRMQVPDAAQLQLGFEVDAGPAAGAETLSNGQQAAKVRAHPEAAAATAKSWDLEHFHSLVESWQARTASITTQANVLRDAGRPGLRASGKTAGGTGHGTKWGRESEAYARRGSGRRPLARTRKNMSPAAFRRIEEFLSRTLTGAYQAWSMAEMYRSYRCGYRSTDGAALMDPNSDTDITYAQFRWSLKKLLRKGREARSPRGDGSAPRLTRSAVMPAERVSASEHVTPTRQREDLRELSKKGDQRPVAKGARKGAEG